MQVVRAARAVRMPRPPNSLRHRDFCIIHPDRYRDRTRRWNPADLRRPMQTADLNRAAVGAFEQVGKGHGVQRAGFCGSITRPDADPPSGPRLVHAPVPKPLASTARQRKPLSNQELSFCASQSCLHRDHLFHNEHSSVHPGVKSAAVLS